MSRTDMVRKVVAFMKRTRFDPSWSGTRMYMYIYIHIRHHDVVVYSRSSSLFSGRMRADGNELHATMQGS